MPPAFRVCALWILGLVAAGGCSGALSTADPGVPPPHGGTLVYFPDGTGVVEVVKKEGSDPISAEVSFYFFKDAWTPYKPAPASGVLVMDDSQKLSLQADGEALVTPTGPAFFRDRDVDGVLRIELGGETKQIPLGVR
jgi:hypothetical protein